MPMVVTRRYSVSVEGAAWKPVRCERCQTQWAYQVKRQFTGQGVSPYMLDNDGAQQRARTAAHKGLEHALQNAREDIPCPRCLNYQADMALRLKKAKYGWLLALGIVGIFLAATFSAVLLDPKTGLALPLALALILVGVGGSIGLLVLRVKLMGGYDPNAEELRPTRQTVLGSKKVILREQYQELMTAAQAEGRADELVQINWA
jgi:hypothetical protein